MTAGRNGVTGDARGIACIAQLVHTNPAVSSATFAAALPEASIRTVIRPSCFVQLVHAYGLPLWPDFYKERMMGNKKKLWQIFFSEVRECIKDYFAPLIYVAHRVCRCMRQRK